jgi:hypothetical protein
MEPLAVPSRTGDAVAGGDSHSQRTRVLDIAGLLPGSCAIDRVHELTSPFCRTLVLLIDWLQVPPSQALALDWAPSICGFSLVLVVEIALPSTAAALPAPPIADAVPEAAPRPIVEADVPPAAALPAVPPVVYPPLETFEPAVVALVCAMAVEATSTEAAARSAQLRTLMTILLSTVVDGAVARR